EPEALARAGAELSAEVARLEREQYAFYVQWNRLRAYALSRGVRLLGDLPFYVGPSSLETWAHRELFQLKPSGEPAAVGGVPPDYFSPVGQLWGNPVYDWQALKRTGFAWWLARVRAQLARMDLLRIDHFRALAAYWAVPAGARDARGGAWQHTPGEELLRRILDEFSDLPLVAEDLGLITEDVLVRAAIAPVARVAVIPAQDLLGLESAARLNTPGAVAGNWTWRLPPGALTTELAQHYRRLDGAFGRAPG